MTLYSYVCDTVRRCYDWAQPATCGKAVINDDDNNDDDVVVMMIVYCQFYMLRTCHSTQRDGVGLFYIPGAQVKTILFLCLITIISNITFPKMRHHSITNEMA